MTEEPTITSLGASEVERELYGRMYAALRAKCPRTALARIRDIAHARHDKYGDNQSDVMAVIIERIIATDTPGAKDAIAVWQTIQR